MAGSVALACAVNGAAVAWIVPTYKNARPVWRFVEQFASGIAEVRRAERLAQFGGQGWLGVFSADNDVSLRGEAFDVVIVDEASRVSEETFTDVIIPTTADRDGRILLISTPNRRNWFYNEWLRGREDGRHQAAWQAPTSANPSPNIQKAFALARERLTERTYRQEWLAEFIEGEGAVFRNVRAVCTLESPDKPEQHAGHSIVIGADWGKSNDYTRLRAGCRNCQRCVDWDGFNRIDYHFQREKLKALVDKWHADVLPERNSIGEPNIEELLRDGIPIMRGVDGKAGYNMGATTKPLLIESLVLAIERGQLRLPKEDADELESYELKVSVNGHPAYSAPEGMHDDRVIADALMWQGMVSAPAFVDTVDIQEYTIGGSSPF